MVREAAVAEKGTTRVGKYELGRTLGEGSFGKVKHAKHVETGEDFAVKILDRKHIHQHKIDDHIKREIRTLKLLRHPNVVRLHEVVTSKTKIYMVLEFVDGGDLFNKTKHKGRLPESEGRMIFQQLIDAISYCHEVGVYHRDLKPENILIDSKGNIKISDFGLSALPQDIEVSHPRFQNDGLLHTTCGSPNYIAPEVLSNRGYDGSMSDIWSCGVILYVMLMGYLPFEDRNIVVLYQKDIFERRIRFTTSYLPSDLFERIESIATKMGFQVQKGYGKQKVIQLNNGSTSPMCPRSSGSLSVVAQVFELSPILYIVELQKSYGDSSFYRKLCRKISEDLGVYK